MVGRADYVMVSITCSLEMLFLINCCCLKSGFLLILSGILVAGRRHAENLDHCFNNEGLTSTSEGV